MAPVLAIVFIADCAMLMRASVLITVGLALNAALWVIATVAWKMSHPGRFLLAYWAFNCSRRSRPGMQDAAERTAADLQQTNADLLATRSLLAESARDPERLRLARELHDVAGHKLTALKLNLTALAAQRQLAAAALDQGGAQLADELLGDIRGVVAQMRQHDGLDLRARARAAHRPVPAAAHAPGRSTTTRASTASRRPRRCCARCRKR